MLAGVSIGGFHPLDGARFLAGAGLSARLAALIAHHSCARFEAEERGLLDELMADFPLERSPVMDRLVCADMTIGPDGRRLDFDQRITETLHRYPPGHVVHRAISRARPTLHEHVQAALSGIQAAALCAHSGASTEYSRLSRQLPPFRT